VPLLRSEYSASEVSNKSFPVLSKDRVTELWRAPFCRRIGVLTARARGYKGVSGLC
jgi:hypothetical protein